MESTVADCSQRQKGQNSSQKGVRKEKKKGLGIRLGQIPNRVIWVSGGEGEGKVRWVCVKKVGIGVKESGLKSRIDDEGKRERQKEGN